MPNRETVEWCQLYWFDADTPADARPRVLLVGDSIVAGTRDLVAKHLRPRASVAAFSTSKIAGDPALYRELALALGDYPIDRIYFNNGLHGLAYDDAFYRRGLEELVDTLGTVSRAPLYWRDSTPVTREGRPDEPHPEYEPVVLRRNALARDVMAKHGIPVDPLHDALAGHPEWRSPDGFHYTAEGNAFIARHVAATVERWLDG